MKIFRDFDAPPHFFRAVATVGSFDGVHRGHASVLRRVVSLARERGVQSVVITFDPHPRQVLGGGVSLLTSLDEKMLLLEQQGVDNVLVVPFTQKFAALTGEEFAAMLSGMGVATLVTGFNQHFGRDRVAFEGNFAGLEVVTCAPLSCGAAVSSTAIRRLLAQGDTAAAEALLGRKVEN